MIFGARAFSLKASTPEGRVDFGRLMFSHHCTKKSCLGP